MKATVLYYSKTGNTKKMAEMIVEGMNEVEGIEAKAFSIDDIDVDWGNDSKCVIIGTPTVMASMTAAVTTWLQAPSIAKGMIGNIGGAFATADYVHGGGDLAIRTIFDHMMVLGMMTYSGGGMQGKPVIHLGPVALAGKLEESYETFRIYGQRMARKTVEIFG